MASSASAGGGVPRIIHQIWLGTNPQPTDWMDTVKDFATTYGYEYKLWTDENIGELDLDAVPGLRHLYAQFGKELAGRADILRMLALYQYGGIYIDADSVMMRPAKFDAFLRTNRAAVFFAWENITKEHRKKLGDFGPELQGVRRLIANGLIGAAPKHPFMKALLTGSVSNAQREKGEHAWRRVGPLYVTRVYKKIGKAHPDVHIYPMKYFYPRHWRGLRNPNHHKTARIPRESMLFQYGYSTNGFAKIFKEREERRQRLRRTRKKGGDD